MTNIELKAQIDADITNKTVLHSINNTDVGNDLKSLVDYTDQEISNINSSLSTVAVTGSYTDLVDTPTLAPVALSNDYNDLDNLPTSSSSVVKMQHTQIQSSQILDLHNTVVPIVTGEAGKIKTILSYIIVYTYGNTPYSQTGSGVLGFHYGNYGSIGTMIPAFVGASQSGKWQYFSLSSMGNMQYYSGEATIGLKLTSGSYINGDGFIDVYVTYAETIL